MKTRLCYMLTILLAFCLTFSIYAGDDEQEQQTLFHKAQITFEKGRTSPTMIKFLEGNQPAVSSFFEEYKQYFRISDENQFQLHRTTRDRIGAHHRYRQRYKDIEIIAAEFILHERNGKAWHANGHLVHGLDMGVTPALNEQAALQTALGHIGAETYMWENPENEAFLKRERGDASATFFPKGELKLTSGKAELTSENMKLVYRFDIYAEKPLSRHYVDIDAKTGEVVNKITRIHDTDVAGSGVSLYNGTVAMIVDQVSASDFRLQENDNTVRAADIRTFDMNNGTDYGAATDFSSTSANGPWDNAGVSAHWGAESTYDYFFTQHGRNSLDNAGFTLLSYVHFDVNFCNAFWDGSIMTYGDGDGVTCLPLVSLDVVGHELTHGVTEFSSNLTYQDESGALNESFSDIFGNAVQLFRENPGQEFGFPDASWRMGEDLITNGIRHMADPNAFNDPDTYLGTFWFTGRADFGGVHTNSGVQNFWFFLLVEGGNGTNDNGDTFNVCGIGLTDAAAIAYHNNNSFLTASSNYNDARNGAIMCAEALFGVGSLQALSTAESWLAVGVGTGPVQDDLSCTLEIQGPVDQQIICDASVTVSGTTSATGGIPPYTFDCEVTNITTGATVVASESGGTFMATVPLEFGANILVAICTVTDHCGAQSMCRDTVEVIRASLPVCTVEITSSDEEDDLHEEDDDIFCSPSATVTGVTSISGGIPPFITSCTVNGIPAVVGINTFTATVPLVSRENLLVATCTVVDSCGHKTVCSDTTDVFLDDKPPICNFTSVGSSVIGEFFDGRSGIANIVPLELINGRLTVDAFQPGDNRVDFRIDAIDPTKSISFNIEITDVCGNSSICDPVFLYLTTDRDIRKFEFTFPMMDRYFQVINHGLSEIHVDLNGNGFKLFSDANRARREVNAFAMPVEGALTIDLLPYLQDGENTMKIIFAGSTGASANLLLLDETQVVDYLLALQTIPVEFHLAQNYPNPFNPSTTIRFDVPERLAEGTRVQLRIYNILGELVRTLVDEKRFPGQYVAQWDGRNDKSEYVSAGIYIYRLQAGDHTQSRRMVLLK